ncbi:hypothetical protein P12x_006142 (plasmid) [Tundrisphaera lichenicola]|uniref:hypothetical protein n=1 Tax=Tundrisphaera lichenicola TaxID=2029860 RepID=UPI003EB83875
MTGRWEKAAARIRSFVDNPVTNLVKGVVLVFIGFSEASRTFREDLAQGHVRLGHGLIIIGLFSILESLPHFIDAMEASERYLELREQKDQEKREAGEP